MFVALSWVRVRTLGEFLFCPRAGLLSHASAREDDEPSDEEINLTFLPEYSLTLIEEQLNDQLRHLAWWSMWVGCGLFLTAVAWWKGLPIIVEIALIVPTFLCIRKTLKNLSAVSILNERRREALAAPASEPSSDLKDDVRVRWWELLKAGFDSVPYLEPLSDSELALVGKPWRVLKKGSLRIPVIRLPDANYHAGRFWVYDQHRLRLAAYAHLLSVSEGGETPYGVVLFGATADGVAIPMTINSMELVKTKVEEFRLCLDSDRFGIPTAVPSDTKVCSDCPLGRPKIATASERTEQALGRRLQVVTGSDGRTYHSDCGDRFQWTPPHDDAVRRNLIRLA